MVVDRSVGQSILQRSTYMGPPFSLLLLLLLPICCSDDDQPGPPTHTRVGRGEDSDEDAAAVACRMHACICGLRD